MDVLEHHAFRVTRNEELEVEEDDTEDLCRRWSGSCSAPLRPAVRLEVEETISADVLDLLVTELDMDRRRSTTCPARSTSPA